MPRQHCVKSDKWLLKLNVIKCMVGIFVIAINIPYSAELENTATIKDLGVIFDPEPMPTL